MSRSPLDEEVSSLQRLQARWQKLPLSYRVNALLYVLGAIALLVLITTLFSSGGNPRQIQVGAVVAPSTTRSPSTTVPPTTSTTVSAFTSTTGATATTGATPSQSSPSNQASTGGSGDGGGSGGGGSGPTNTESPVSSPPCPRNSTEPCGENFRWDPQPTNQPPTFHPLAHVPVVAGQEVEFTLTVSEPDHSLSGACLRITFGHESPDEGDCPPRPCPPRYGPWDPPAPGPADSKIFRFRHTYPGPGNTTYPMRIWLESRDDCHDPYGTAIFSDASMAQANIHVAPAPS